MYTSCISPTIFSVAISLKTFKIIFGLECLSALTAHVPECPQCRVPKCLKCLSALQVPKCPTAVNVRVPSKCSKSV